ncbi:MAG: CRISPR-associated protein Cas5 [Bryobacteraceae bacterium]
MPRLAVVRVTVEAPVTSFRYPHFLVGRQVSYDMPPPSTIYGHIASALGELPGPGDFEFGYDFRFAGRASDLEHQHIINAGGQAFTVDGKKYPASVHATIQPHLRDFLFRPKLVLYVNRRDWLGAFQAPVFCVILGRSQDLASVTEVDEIELEQRDGAYFEHTLLPFSYRPYVALGTTVLMPRMIGPPPERRTHFDRFITLHRERLFGGHYANPDGVAPARRMIRDTQDRLWWVDPDSPVDREVHRAVVLHSCA